MEAPKPVLNQTPSKMKEFPISIGKDGYKLTIICLYESIKFILNNENDEQLKFEISLRLDELNKVSKWFKIFDNIEEVFVDIIKLMENKQINIIKEENIAKLIFNINIEKIKEFDIILSKKELSKDEMINILIKENKELKNRLNLFEKRLDKFKEKFKSFEKNKSIESNKIEQKNEIWDSDIINNEDKQTLNNWINTNNDKKIKLLYKASRDGDSYRDFYRLCENKGPTVTIALTTKGYKFGGFTSLSWKNPNSTSSHNKYYEDKNAFIFSLNRKKKYYPKKYEKSHVCMWNDRGPSFGGGNDLTLNNNCLHNNNSYNDCPFTYETEKYELNGGEKNFTVKDYEVYSIN